LFLVNNVELYTLTLTAGKRDEGGMSKQVQMPCTKPRNFLNMSQNLGLVLHLLSSTLHMHYRRRRGPADLASGGHTLPHPMLQTPYCSERTCVRPGIPQPRHTTHLKGVELSVHESLRDGGAGDLPRGREQRFLPSTRPGASGMRGESMVTARVR
jgi:hypothetical protein